MKNLSAVPRREFLRLTAWTAGLAAIQSPRFTRAAAPSSSSGWHLATNVYPWLTFYGRENRDFMASLDEGLAAVKAAGLDGFEPIITAPDQIATLAALLQKHGLQMRSLYVNSTLHEADQADRSLREILAIATAAKTVGTQIVVTNPSPIQWGGANAKTDGQLRVQADALNRLGEELGAMGLVLAYHNHDMELHHAAREFHHMMVGTDPANVTLCLDAHWIYRGSGNSVVALFDVVKLYGSRVTELHLRQSQDQIWTEAFGPGDIDYAALAQALQAIGRHPHLVLEQAVENGTAKDLDAVEAHRRGVGYAREIFG